MIASLAIAGAGLVLAVDWAVPSLLNFYWRSGDPVRWERFLRYIIRLHAETVGPFTRRPVTTALLHQAYLIFHDAWVSFLVVQGALLTASGIALGYLAKREDSVREGLGAVAVYFLSFTVLFSFVSPNDSFDEPAQYLFLFLSLYFLRERLALGFSCAFLLALLSRETSLLLLPGMWLVEPKAAKPINRALKYFLPIAAWAAFYFWKNAPGDPGRFGYWAKNFASPSIAFETFLSLGLALTLPALAFFSGRPKPEDAPWQKAFLLTFFLNTPIVLFAAYARESRLLALPAIFLWPKAGPALEWWRAVARSRKLSTQPLLLLTGALALSVAIWFSYQPHYRHVLSYRLYGSLLPLLWLIALLARAKPAAYTLQR